MAAMDDPLDTSDMPTARAHMKRLLVEWRDAGASADSLVLFLEGFVACKVAEILREHQAYTALETKARQNTGAPDCPKCGGAGWLRGSELDNASDDTCADTMTRYSCDSEQCRRAAHG